MQWSKFNLMFSSKDGELLLYNSGSNSYIQLDADSTAFIDQIKINPNQDFSDSPDLGFKLRLGGFLVEDGADDDLVRILKMNRIAASYAENQLSLTIAITKCCDFDCAYCYEQNRTPPVMSDETADKLVQFISKHKLVNKIKITWYGGEPLMEFDKLKSLSNKIQSLGLEYDAQMITNGYRLTPEIIETLNGLKISSLQITIDGSKETHDKRRHLKCGGKTYDQIINNIDNLLSSKWEGQLNLRMNIDKQNSHEFKELYKFIEHRYPYKFNKQVRVYPGFVDDYENYAIENYFDSYDKGKFLTTLSEDYGINPLKIFPHMELGGCTMTRKNAYVVGPEGELYKCWRDLGNEREKIGDIFCFTGWNMALIAEGMIGASYLYDESCENCLLFPICDGGCPKLRMLNKRDKGRRNTCTYFKTHMERLLEVYCRHKVM